MLVVVTFRGWYGLDGTYLSAWDLLEFGRYLLLATAAAALVLLLFVATGRSSEASFLAAARATALGSVCAVYIGYRLFNRPDALDPGLWAFTGFASALLVIAGGIISTRGHSASRSWPGDDV
jgi:hypothetical protein